MPSPRGKASKEYDPKPPNLNCGDKERGHESWPVSTLWRDAVKPKNTRNEHDDGDVSINQGPCWPPAIAEIDDPCRMKHEHRVRGDKQNKLP
jgi:hypothetical protein